MFSIVQSYTYLFFINTYFNNLSRFQFLLILMLVRIHGLNYDFIDVYLYMYIIWYNSSNYIAITTRVRINIDKSIKYYYYYIILLIISDYILEICLQISHLMLSKMNFLKLLE